MSSGFIPTFGPAFIHLYGSTRDYNFIDEHSNLNDGLGEGVSYRGRLLIALKTDISDSIDTAPSEVEVMPTQTINEVSDSAKVFLFPTLEMVSFGKVAYGKREEFFLFGCVMEATMIDKRLGDRNLQIEVSCGNAGNSIDGQLVSATKSSGHDTDSVASGAFDHDSSESSHIVVPLSTTRISFFSFSKVKAEKCRMQPGTALPHPSSL